MKPQVIILSLTLLVMLSSACNTGNEKKAESASGPKIVKEFRDDGTLSSAKQVDSEGYIHGVRVNYYEDGRTVHSKITYEHGRKHGPAEWYFKDGTVGERTYFYYGKRKGITRRYHDNGNLREEVEYDLGEEVPGSKKEYDLSGNLKD